MKIFFYILISVLTFVETCNSQSNDSTVIIKQKWKNPEKKIGYNLSYSYQTQSVLEIGCSRYHKIKIGRTPYKEFHSKAYVKDYWSSGVSLNFVLGKRFILAPKIFTNISYKLLSAQLNLSAFTDFKNMEPVFTPEIGIGRVIGIRYGYNFKILNKSFHEMGNHRLVVFFNLYFPHFRHVMGEY